ncbi:M48 family metallopeptidase [Ilyomonas limi]|uniref:M48 family metallopeptidase n=1 Tax=Ilyomonas limi TaxID=2575867 RepID=A0A4V5UTV7_9BACT|nr:M48 family metallopeptidase [Ilyomonas limi]TKK66643.1 M48 family metallopeptidase [Ilyomonas limi]
MKWKYYVLIALTALFAYACTRNAITGRNQLSLVSESELQTTAKTQYRQFLAQHNVVSASNNKDAEMVKRVGSRIASAITEYYRSKGQGDALKGYKWEFNLVQSNEINAWCMPGGKVVVYTGILPVTQNEAALAIVLGHEITHAVAGHGRERMSQGLLAAGIQQLGQGLLGNSKALNIFNAVYAPTAQIGVLLPNSRNQELEADHYGLIFAALAGYNPEEAIPFWQRMQSLAGGSSTPVFLSDHPAEADRIQHLQEWMPEALKYYKPVKSR